MKYIIFCLISLFSILKINAQESYLVYDKNGQEAKMSDIIQLAKERPLIFFGELHDQKFAHQAENDLLNGLFEKYNNKVVLGMEMFETDVQPIIDEYFTGKINQQSFENESRVWKNYKDDYKPLLEFAKDHQIKFIATNVPRRYANSVYHQGLEILDQLSPFAKQHFPQLPLEVDTNIQIYKEMLDMMPDHSNANMIYSQALKDATMAQSILNNKASDEIFLHINGSYHSKNKQGILSYLKGYPLEKTITINAVLQDDASKKPDFSIADYTILPNK